MSFTRLDVQTRLGNFFNNPTYYSTQNYNDSIQDGVDEIVAFTGAIMKSATLDFTPNLTWYDMVSLLPDYIGVIAVFNPQNKRWLLPTSLKKMNEERLDWEVVTGTPAYFTVVNFRYMAIFRKPAVAYGKMYLYYMAAAPTLDDNTPIPIPDDHIQVVQDYANMDLQEQSQEFTKSEVLLQQYMEDLEVLRVALKEQRNADRVRMLK